MRTLTQAYYTDLTQGQSERLDPLIPAANVSDQRGANVLFWQPKRLVGIWPDSGYRGEDCMQRAMHRSFGHS